MFKHVYQLVLACILFLASNAQAESHTNYMLAYSNGPEVLTQKKKWRAVKPHGGIFVRCLAASKPVKASITDQNGDKVKINSPIYVVFSHASNSQSLRFGMGHSSYDYNSPEIIIGKEKFGLRAHGETAFPLTDEDEIAMIKAMKKGAKMILKATTPKGHKIQHEFSLMGASAAFNSVIKACPPDPKEENDK